MPVEVRIPTLGESVSEGVIVRWMKRDGDAVKVDEPLLELETDKASVEIPALSSGVLKVLKPEGATVTVGEIVASIDGARSAKTAPADGKKAQPEATPAMSTPGRPAGDAAPAAAAQPEPAPAAAAASLSPAVRRLIEEHNLQPQEITPSGKDGRLTKADVMAHLEKPRATPAPATNVAAATDEAAATPASGSPPSLPANQQAAAAPSAHVAPPGDGAELQRVPMSNLRKRIAERLVQAQHTAAILTTFNEVDMSAVMALRSQHKERFKQVHGVNLGFMSFFARACIAALQELPNTNASLDGTDIIYHRRVHLGIAVGTERGLVVPVVHNADQLTFAGIEKEIERLAGLAREAKLGIHDLSGGTFTISNGGVYGSLMSTPILNPPQSAILGMHKIEKRAVVVNDQVVIRSMMYLALSYDHRLIDGEQAVTFLVKVKERIEDPSRLLLEV